MNMFSKNSAKKILGELPLTAEIYWMLRQGGQPPVGGYHLERVKDHLPTWISQAKAASPDTRETKRVLIFSPHPDDDVICMGGTMTRLAEQKHEVHVAYMVSGNLSVFDHTVARYADFVREFNSIFNLTPDQTEAIEEHIDLFLRQKKPTDVDSPEIQSIKGLVRKIEAIDAARYCGLPEEHTHFLNIPFYNTGKVQKLSVGPDDIKLVEELLERIKPDMVFAAGDMSDPHGTHRLCLEVLLIALERCKNKLQLNPELWLNILQLVYNPHLQV